MSFKSIDEFTIEECQNYIYDNPNGELIFQVRKRLEYLEAFDKISRWFDVNRKKETFNEEFNRLRITKRWEEAFFLCLNNVNAIGNNQVMSEKANSIIPHLRKRVLLPLSMPVTYDMLIDELSLRGETYIKLNGSDLLLNLNKIHISSGTDKTEILIGSIFPIWLRIIGWGILLYLILLLVGFTVTIGNNDFPLILAIPMAIIGWTIFYFVVRVMIKSRNSTVSKIAKIIVERYIG